MATLILVDFPQGSEKKKKYRYADIILMRWGERQGGAAFISADNRFILTDYVYNHKEMGLLRHMLNCNHLLYREVTNVDLEKMGEEVFARALINNNKTEKEH